MDSHCSPRGEGSLPYLNFRFVGGTPIKRGCCPNWIITQQDHKVRKDGLFEQKLAKVAKFTDPRCCFGDRDQLRFWRRLQLYYSICSTLAFASFANFCSNDLSLHPCCTRRNWATAPTVTTSGTNASYTWNAQNKAQARTR